MEGNRRASLRSYKLLNPERVKPPPKPFSVAIKDDFKSLRDLLSDYKQSYISTPFEGSCLKLINNGKNVVFTSNDGRIANCDLQKKQLILHHQIDPNISIESLAITKDSQFIYIGVNDGLIYKLRFDTFEPKGTFERHEGKIVGLYLNVSENELYSAGDLKVVKWPNTNDSSKCKELYTHNAPILSFDLSLDCVHVASGDASGVFKVFSLSDNQEKYSSDPISSEILSLKISHKNTFLILGTSSKGIQVYNFGDWSLAREFNDVYSVSSVTINPEETMLISGNSDGVAKIWNLEKWQDEISIQAHSGDIKTVIITEDNKKIFTIGSDKRIVVSKVSGFGNHFNLKTECKFMSFRPNVKTDSIYALSTEGHLIEIKETMQERIAKFEKPVLNWSIISNGIEIAAVFEPLDSKHIEVAIVPLSKPRTIRYYKYKTESRATSACFAWEGEVLIIGQSFKLSVLNIKEGSNAIKNHTFRTHTGQVSYITTEKNQIFAGDDTGIIKFYTFGLKYEEQGQMVDDTHSKVTLIKPMIEQRLIFSGNEDGEVIIWSIEKLVHINKVSMNAQIKEIYFTRDKANFFISSGENLTLWNMEDLSREAIFTMSEEISAFMLTCDESHMIYAFESSIKVMENPLVTEKLSIFGNHEKVEKFVKYLVKIVNNEFPKHDAEMDDWLIEPYHINTLHLYSYFDMAKHLAESITAGASFFNSRSGYSPMIISLEKKSYDCIDSIYESLKARSSFDKMSLFRLSSALPGLNKFGYSKLQDLYSVAFNHCFAFDMPKFVEDSVSLPVVVKSKRYFIPHWRFADKGKFLNDEVAVEFKQSFVQVNTRVGALQSLEFMKSLVECSNPEIYTTELVQVILQDKWKKLSWILTAEMVLYMTYMMIVCYIVQFDRDLQQVSVQLWVAFGINALLFVYEMMQMIASGILYFTSFWNYVDMLRFLCFTSYSILIYLNEVQTANKYLLISTVILSLLRGVSYFRLISSVRWVIKLLFDVISELWALTFVVIYTGAASFEFYKFLEKENLNEILPLSQEHFRIQYTTVIFIVLINPLIILNLYLAIIGEKLEKSENEKVILDGQELAEMIYEAEILFFCNRKYKKPKFIHVLQEEAPNMMAQKTSSQRIKKMAENVVSVEKNCEKSNRDIQALIEFVKGETVEINEKVQEITKRINRD